MTRSTFLSFLPLLSVSLAPSLIRGAVVTLYEVYPTDLPVEPSLTDLPAVSILITAAAVGSDGSTTYLMEGSAGSDGSSTDSDSDSFTLTFVEGSQGLNDSNQICSFDGNGKAACVVDLGNLVTSTGDGGTPFSTEVFTTYTGALSPIATLVDGGAVLTQPFGPLYGAGSGESSSSATPTSGGASATPSASAGGASQEGGGASTPEGGSNSTSSVAPQTSGGGGNSTSNTTNAAARGLDAKGHYGWLIRSSLVGIISGIWLV